MSTKEWSEKKAFENLTEEKKRNRNLEKAATKRKHETHDVLIWHVHKFATKNIHNRFRLASRYSHDSRK